MLLIAIPCYGGLCYADFMLSLFKLTETLQKVNIPFEIKLVQSESLIPRARNGFVNMFMQNPNYSKLLFLDNDLIFDPTTILRMIQQYKPIVGASYPKKQINWKKVKHYTSKDSNISEMELKSKISDMNYNFKMYGNQVKLENGFVEVEDIPTGCMLIDKRAMSMIINKYRDENYINNSGGYGRGNCFYDLFKTGIVEVRKQKIYLSEDYYFCHLARECGISLWLDTEATLVHIGRNNYIGSIGNILKDSSGEVFDNDVI